MSGMATLFTMFVVGVLLVLGGLVLGGARNSSQRDPRCSSCGKSNVGGAKYCAQCGAQLRK